MRGDDGDEGMREMRCVNNAAMRVRLRAGMTVRLRLRLRVRVAEAEGDAEDGGEGG